MNKQFAAVVLALALTPVLALTPLLPDWGGVIYKAPAVTSQTFHA